MKKIYFLILLGILISSQAVSQTFQAVNDTIDLYPGIPKTVDLLANDTTPPGDSLRITNMQYPSPITSTLLHKGFYTFSIIPWGNSLTFSGTYLVRDYTLGKNSTAKLIFRIHDNSYDSLEINNVKAGITAFGNEFYLPGAGRSIFKIPKDSLTGTVFTFSLWAGGRSNDSSLYFAGERYRQGPNNGTSGMYQDFCAGPVMDSVNYSIYQDTVWNRVWKIKRSDIDYHISHWNNPGYTIPVNIRTWPGNGNTAYGQADQLAPFYDRNNDGRYNAADGDYPMIKGDEAIFAIFNDDRGAHTESGGAKMKLEFHLMAYAFNLPGDTAFKNAIFLNYKIFNRSSRTYYNTFLGTFADLDIGYAADDFIGCDVGRSSIIGYNGKATDYWIYSSSPCYGAHPPAQSVTILGGPFMDPTGQDRPRLGLNGHPLCDESVNGTGFGDSIANNERYGLTNFLPLFNLGSSTYMLDPSFAPEYYRAMHSIWHDSTRLFYGGMGHAGFGGYGPDCRFGFPGKSDTLNLGTGCRPPDGPSDWTMNTAGAIPGNMDIRGTASMGPFTFRPGDVQELDLAFIFARDYNSLDTVEQSVAKLRQMIDIVKNSYTTGVLPGGGSFFGINEHPSESSSGIKIYPNPATDRITIEIKSQNILKNSLISIYDIQGQLVFEKSVSQKSMNIDISNLASGVYIVKLNNNTGVEVSRFIKN